MPQFEGFNGHACMTVKGFFASQVEELKETIAEYPNRTEYLLL